MTSNDCSIEMGNQDVSGNDRPNACKKQPFQNCKVSSHEDCDLQTNKLIERLRRDGKCYKSELNNPKLSKPEWFDEDLFNNAKQVYSRHFMAINFAHFSGLILLVRSKSIFSTLDATGNSASAAKLFRRYYNTVSHVKKWYEGDIFLDGSEAKNSLLIVRAKHDKVSRSLNADKSVHVYKDQPMLVDGNSNNLVEGCKFKRQVHMSEYDIMITQFAFIGLILTKPKLFGLVNNFSERDMESMIHFWRVIGYFLGASNDYNLCAYPKQKCIEICQNLLSSEYKQSIIENQLESPPGLMSINIVRAIKFLPMLTVYGMMRYLYEALECKVSQADQNIIEGRKTWYSNISYTLMKTVMTSFLGFAPLRHFNNGLTRLSLYLIGNFENWFSERLNSKYGCQLTT